MDKEKRIAFFDDKAEGWDRNSQERKEELSSLLSLLPLKKGRKVLDVACGTGVRTPLLEEITQAEVKAIDFSPKRIEKAKEKYKRKKNRVFVCEDFLEGKESGYDFVLIFNAYPHFLDVKEFEASLAKAVRQGGYFAILHDLSRQELTRHHRHCQDLSRELKPAKEEAKPFEKDFTIEKTQEGEHLFLILGKRK